MPRIELPNIYAINDRLKGKTSTIQQLLLPPKYIEVVAEERNLDGIHGFTLTENQDEIFATYDSDLPNGYEKVIKVDKGVQVEEIRALNSTWVKHPLLPRIPRKAANNTYLKSVISSWANGFKYIQEDRLRQTGGLRIPQSGAIHAIHAHWAVSEDPATIVIPTGIGKTETMLGTLISERCDKLLVIVPTNALRDQITDKFLALGILKEIGVVSSRAKYPVVGCLKNYLKTVDEVDNYFKKCNVVVTTMSAVGCIPIEARNRMANHCPYLFVDEAHHIPARTWQNFINTFSTRKILQFTATPFRNDHKLIDGKIIFNYPLKKAQSEEYFKTIHFKPVQIFDNDIADEKIAEKAVEQLRSDPVSHILMARVNSISRAKEVFEIYQQYSEFNPVQIHTGIKSQTERDEIRKRLLGGQTRIVICVDMLGEGFNLPELKIAAFHDVKKSLPATLQLAGRFTRSREDLGDATFIANIGDIEVRDELRKLYREDTDWNTLLEQSSEQAISQQVELQEFIDGFSEFPENLPLKELRPAMSTVIYKTTCKNWTPEKFEDGISGLSTYDRVIHGINDQDNTLVIVTVKKTGIDWVRVREIFTWDWELYVVYWDSDQNLLFINGSSNLGYYKALAESIAGEVELISGPPVFRCFSGINRLKLKNVGLIEQVGRYIRYIMRAGSDVESGLSETQKQNVRKSNIFGSGFENGEKTTVGCSYKGRIWSYRVANVKDLIKWCSSVGRKILDEGIDPDQVLRGTLKQERIVSRPKKMPVRIDWPEIIYKKPENKCVFLFGEDEKRVPMYEMEIELIQPSLGGNIRFRIASENENQELELILSEGNYIFSSSTDNTKVKYGNSVTGLKEFFNQNPPAIWFVDGSVLEGNNFTESVRRSAPFPHDRIAVLAWDEVDIQKESQGITKDPKSIQHFMINKLIQDERYEVVFDDDGAGEAADIVAIGTEMEEKITVELYHCKYSRDSTPGARISDLYEVCGQAQKSIHWMDKKDPGEIFEHLLRRNPRKVGEQELTRFEKGDERTLLKIMEMSRVLVMELKIFIVQPGLSRSNSSQNQLELLGATENYLMETFQLPLGVIASK